MATPSEIPLRQVALSQWSSADVQTALDERPLLLHLQRVRSQPSHNRKRIILFVHGLSSSAATWLTFLTHAFSRPELEPYDFGMFNYQTSVVSRLNPFQRLPRPEDWARVLASVIRNTVLAQERYDSFVLVGHSMGGLVSKFAIRYLLESDMSAASRLHSLFTYGTPNHGSDRANVLGALLSPDLALLRAFSSPIQDLLTFWNTRISALPDTPGRFIVHERALVSAKDYWVAQSSGISSLPEAFVERIASSHAGLLRPAGPGDPRLSWFVNQLQAIQRRSECTLIEMREGPAPDDFLGDDAGEKLAQALFRARFVLDAGSADGVTKGEQFGLYYEPEEVKDKHGRVIDRIPGPMNLLGAIEVKERVTYCALESFAYEAGFRRLGDALKSLNGPEDAALEQAQINALVLSLFGRIARRIPRTESEGHKRLEDIYGRVLDEEVGSAPRRKILVELTVASRDFLTASPTSVFADHAAFQEAWATMGLERYDEAEQLFERFCENYPFSTSVSGARAWIDEIQLRIALRDSTNAPEPQLALAEYLVKKQTNPEEAMRLGFDAYERKPALLGRMSPALRFFVAAEYVFHQVLDMDIEAPEAMSALLATYANDPAERIQTRARIESKVPLPRAAMLIQLLDSLPPAADGAADVEET
jgi:pimeloyl-ACP methyl ester carboxylesterase